jgi:ketosteroid isomerase-like protein
MVEAAIDRETPSALLAPDFQMENHVAAAVDYSYNGASGWREWLADLFEVFAEGARFRNEELIAVGDDLVAAMFCVDGRSVRSGNWIAFRWMAVTWFRDGMVTRIVGYSSRGVALKAVEVGLRERARAHSDAQSPRDGALWAAFQATAREIETVECDDRVSLPDRRALSSLTRLRLPGGAKAGDGSHDDRPALT